MEKITRITISLKKNNFFINLLLDSGKSFYSSGGKERFSGKQKNTSSAFSAACYKILNLFQKHKTSSKVCLFFKGNSFKTNTENEYNTFLSFYTKFSKLPKIYSITDSTPIFHGNIKTKNLRRK